MNDPDPVLEELRRQVAELGLELDLGRRNTPGQLAFAVPVRGLDSWRTTLKRDGRRVAYGDGVTEVAAIRDALGMLDRTSQSYPPGREANGSGSRADHMVSEADLNPRDIRERLREVLASVQTLPPQDVENVSGLIDAGEWGLALDTLCTQVCEYDIELSPAARASVDELGERTDVDAKRLLGES